jgi:hypothetical protein
MDRLSTLQLALDEIEQTIQTMQEKDYPQDKIQPFLSQRFQLWNEMYKEKKNK